MKLKKICLENIRSYEKLELAPSGKSVLLSGDVGAGKSTILLALEFAIFGTQRGALSGASLLRKGEQKGKVSVILDIDGKDVILERNLLRKKDSVKQDIGFIEIDGHKENFSVEEMNSVILKLVGYPQIMAGINPSMLYRYTVYTPQEEMKQILIENSEERLNILRNVLGTNKYKTIIQNIEVITKILRDNARKKEGKISDLEAKKVEFEKRKQIILQFSSELREILPKLDESSKNALEKKRILSEIEKEKQKLNEIEKSIKSNETAIISKKDELRRNQLRIEVLNLKIKNLEAEVEKSRSENLNVVSLNEQIAKREREFEEAIASEREIAKTIASIETKKSDFSANLDKINKLNNCPLCQQQVPHEHKEKIARDLQEFCRENDKKLSLSNDSLKEIKNKIINLKEDLKKAREMKEKNEKILNVIKEYSEKKADLQILVNDSEKINKDISKSGGELENFRKNIEPFKDVDSRYGEASLNYDLSKEQETKIQVQKTKIETNLKNYEDLTKMLEIEIMEKENCKNDLEKLRSIEFWLSNEFVSLMAFIEKNVLLKLNFEFNQFFQKWFSMLIAEESFSVNINEEFTPIIEQNGYELEYDFLSGGERTAAALAYRLALNQVLNSLYSNIKTRGLLVLDEPTDGFSSEQLDKMRTVLQELNVEQLILVSHEQKMESFVDSILKFKKLDGATKISN